MLYVVDVVVDPSLHLVRCVGLTSKSTDLGPPCDSRLGPVTGVVATNDFRILLVVRHRMGTRPDQRHSPQNNVKELRQFVQASTA